MRHTRTEYCDHAMTAIHALKFDVRDVRAQLDAQPGLWNAYTIRTKSVGSPHSDTDDIWVRFNDWQMFHRDHPAAFADEHDSVWYPAYRKLPALEPIIFDVMRHVCGVRLGGVLITRVPPGKSVKPHTDSGWHAHYYRKFAVQLAGGEDQAFCFEGERLVAHDGDVYEFHNQYLHWVVNDSVRDRITLIICIRTGE